MLYVAGCLIHLYLMRHVVDSIDDVGWAAVLVEFADGVSLEVQIVGLLLCTLVPAFVQLKVSYSSLVQTF